MFCIFGLLIYRALEPKIPIAKRNWRRMLIALAIVIVYGAADEFHQGQVPGRTVDLYDLAADTFGGLLSVGIVYMFPRKSPRRDEAA